MTTRTTSRKLKAPDLSRRKFLGTTAVAGLAGAGLSMGLSACNKGAGGSDAGAASAGAADKAAAAIDYEKYEVHPGKLDTYYAFSSGGHSGEVRVLGIPSGREIKRIPVFNYDCMVGWGITNESKAIIGTKPDGSLKYTTGDTHHVHMSYTNGTYDGKHIFVNDKINARLARIRLDTMECDKILELPNVQGFHGVFPDKCDPVDPKINHTTRVSAVTNSTSRSPMMAAIWKRTKSISACSPAWIRKPWNRAGSARWMAIWTWLPPPTTARLPAPTSTTPKTASITKT
jgi:nitrous-oxide reductase